MATLDRRSRERRHPPGVAVLPRQDQRSSICFGAGSRRRGSGSSGRRSPRGCGRVRDGRRGAGRRRDRPGSRTQPRAAPRRCRRRARPCRGVARPRGSRAAGASRRGGCGSRAGQCRSGVHRHRPAPGCMRTGGDSRVPASRAPRRRGVHRDGDQRAGHGRRGAGAPRPDGRTRGARNGAEATLVLPRNLVRADRRCRSSWRSVTASWGLCSTSPSRRRGRAATAGRSRSGWPCGGGSRSVSAISPPPRSIRVPRSPRPSCALRCSFASSTAVSSPARCSSRASWSRQRRCSSLSRARSRATRSRPPSSGSPAVACESRRDESTRHSPISSASAGSQCVQMSRVPPTSRGDPAALAHLALAEHEPAKRLAAEELELARTYGAPRALGIAERAAGLVAGGDRGASLLREAVGALERSDARLERARALADLGAMLRRRNRRMEARELLGEALEAAHRIGARPLAERAETELRASGGRPRRTVLTGLDSLDGQRTPHRRARRPGSQQPRDRSDAVRHQPHGRRPPHERLPQAARRLADEASSRACRAGRRFDVARVPPALRRPALGVYRSRADAIRRRSARRQRPRRRRARHVRCTKTGGLPRCERNPAGHTLSSHLLAIRPRRTKGETRHEAVVQAQAARRWHARDRRRCSGDGEPGARQLEGRLHGLVAAGGHAGDITPPPLPAGMAPVPAGNKLFLGTHAVGTQNYVCRPSGAGVAYVLFTPQATLFGEDGGQIITHYFSHPNPDEPNTDPKVVAPRARSAPRGSSRTRAGSGPSCTNPMERSPSTRMRLPGSCSMRLESRTDRPVATS